MSESLNSAANAAELAEENRKLRSQIDALDTLFSSISDFAFTLDCEGRFLFANQSLLDLWERSLDEIIGKNFYELEYPKELADKLVRQIEEVCATGQRVSDQVFYISPAGAPGFYEHIFSPILDADGKVGIVAGTSRDITARKRIEDELEDIRLRLAATLTSAEIGTWTWNCVDDVVIADRNLARLFNVSEDDAAGGKIEKYLAAIHPDDADAVGKTLRRALEKGDSYEAVYRLVQNDETVRWVVARGQVLRDKTGAPVSLPGVVIDITETKAAEEKLRESDSRLSDALKIARLGGFEWNLSDNTVLLDRRSREIFGFPAETAVVGADEIFARIHPADHERIYKESMEGAASARGFETDYRIVLPDGSVRVVLSLNSAVVGETGRTEKMIGVFSDLTESRRAEQTLRESEERYRMLFNSIDEGFCTCEVIFDENDRPIDYRMLELNPSFEKLTGISAEAALSGKTIREVVPNLEESWYEIYGRVAWTGEAARFENGSEALGRWFDVYAFRFGEPEERKVAILFTNITERKMIESESERARQQLEAERARLAYIFENAPAFVAVLRGPEHVFEITNPAYQQLIGHREILGKSIREALPEISGQGYYELLDQVFQTGEPYIGRESVVELQHLPESPHEKKILNFVYQPIFEADRTISGIFVHGVDITAQVEARRQAETANSLKDEFLATLSHELRTPLNAILGWSQMLQKRELSKEEKDKAVAIIERSARSQNQLIDDLLDVSRIITGKLRLDVRAVDLPNVIAAAVDSARPGAEAKNIRLQLLIDPQAGPISGDPERLQQVVWNLLSNAVKFTPKGGRVQVRLERVNSHVEIVVSDTGKGIEPEFLAQVFDRFSQLDGSMTRRHGGLGLGLAIVRQLVELHGGTVSAESGGSDQGATFTIALPLLPMHSEPAHEIVRNGRERARREKIFDCPAEIENMRVLIVDDEEDSRELLATVLDACGAFVTAADSARAAFAEIRNAPFDVIISDIGMPEEDGFSLIGKIRALPDEENGNVPAIALTAYASSDVRIKALRSGFQMHVPKPVDPLELIAVIANLTERMKKDG